MLNTERHLPLNSVHVADKRGECATTASLLRERLLAAKLFEGPLDALHHRSLALTEPLAWVVVALVRLVFALGVADLALEIALLGLVEVEQALPVGPLRVGVDVHLDDAMADGRLDLLWRRARAAVEDEEERL